MKPFTRLRFTSVVCAAICISSAFFSTTGVAQPTVIYVSNYDVKLTVGGELIHITNQARVRDGRTIPIEFQKHRIDVSVFNNGDGQYRAIVDVLERGEQGWYRINTEDLSFEATYAVPVKLQWTDGDISMDLAIAISVFNQ